MSSNKSADAHILLVDDNREGLTARKSVLEELGFKILTATSAHVALELFGRHAFDLVVTDYKMPDMSGIELIQKIRKQKPATPVILISGFVDVLGLDTETTGADIVMMKNANEVTHLVRSVTRLLNQKRPPGNAGSAKRLKKTG
jgi:CheY-like chemotaxis protein